MACITTAAGSTECNNRHRTKSFRSRNGEETQDGKMKTKNGLLFSVILACAAAVGLAAPASAQSDSQKSATPAKYRGPTKKQAPASKTHKVWTEDDLATVRTPADSYAEKETAQAQAAAAAIQQQQTDAATQTSATPAKPSKTPPLAHANSVDDADKKIAWEERDVQAQEEFIDRIQQELGQAPPDQREHLQKVIEENKQILADTRKELAGLQEQRKQLEKPTPRP